MKAATLDTCAVIAAFDKTRFGHVAMCLLKEAWERGQVRLVISRRTLHELRKKPDNALAFAEKLEVLPYYAIGDWNDCDDVSWDQLGGTWDDAARMDGLQRALPVRKKVKIKDRGILVDSMQAGIRIVVTTDDYVLSRANGVQRAMGVRPATPDDAVKTLLGGDGK